jgi:hypothetical protein
VVVRWAAPAGVERLVERVLRSVVVRRGEEQAQSAAAASATRTIVESRERTA